jgi:prepilin-type processing-associated H-X9-DG protein
MFWKNWSWPKRILSVIFVGFVAAVLYPVFARSRENDGHGPSCQSRLKQIGLGLIQYTQDYDEHFPPVAARGAAYGWADALQPYVKSTRLFQCPSEYNEGQTDPRLSGYTDYWFNVRLSKRELKTINEPARLIAAGDGNDGTDLTDARYSISALPPQWMSDANSPLYRHFEAANYLFADGHVKAMKPTSVSNHWSQTDPSFEPEQAR